MSHRKSAVPPSPPPRSMLVWALILAALLVITALALSSGMHSV
jgi:hypothetical protein